MKITDLPYDVNAIIVNQLSDKENTQTKYGMNNQILKYSYKESIQSLLNLSKTCKYYYNLIFPNYTSIIDKYFINTQNKCYMCKKEAFIDSKAFTDTENYKNTYGSYVILLCNCYPNYWIVHTDCLEEYLKQKSISLYCCGLSCLPCNSGRIICINCNRSVTYFINKLYRIKEGHSFR